MASRRSFLRSAALFPMLIRRAFSADHRAKALDPRGRIHIPIGIPDTLDAVKTFVKAEGVFSPGFGTYGVYFWVYDWLSQRLMASTMDGVPCDHGLRELGFLIPWSEWNSGPLRIRSEVCHMQRRGARTKPTLLRHACSYITLMRESGSSRRAKTVLVRWGFDVLLTWNESGPGKRNESAIFRRGSNVAVCGCDEETDRRWPSKYRPVSHRPPRR